ncbi:mitogen-activated protein kinase kinase kinase 12-like [Anneissia japonica]|uniref:mitogen-activated protein kinase kinase kinase 12-like n=1 Tax=Anneissia japonica TaxID=1529436 RepID=UPI001425A608|nr:mitogen-activated protein kinase kinase kinase 12-like [Anneissia japonica]
MAAFQIQFQIFQPTDVEIGQHCGISNKPIVCQGKVRRNGDVVAVKNIKHVQQGELDILKLLQHDHVVRLLGTIESDGVVPTQLVLEYSPHGNLYEFLHTAIEFLPHFLSWCKQAACAVGYIHQQNISHRDIKSKTYLVFGDVIKLTDFGISKITNDITGTTHGGTILWMSPEVLGENDNVDHFKSDIYSLGIVLWELYHRRIPYDKWKLKDIIQHVINYKGNLEIDDGCDISGLLLSCWEYEPTQRPTADEILKSLNERGTSTYRYNRNSRQTGQNKFYKVEHVVELQTPEPAAHPQPTSVGPTTTEPRRDWQKEGRNQIRSQKRKENKHGKVTIYDREFKFRARMKLFKFYSTATDCTSGVNADAGGYKSLGGANEHAIENLINKLLAEKIISN